MSAIRRIATTTARVVVMNAATIAASYTAQGGDSNNEIEVKDFDYITLFVNYTKGDESGIKVKVEGMDVSGGSLFQLGAFTNASGTLTNEPQELQLTATIKAVPWLLDVRGVLFIKISQARTSGGTPTGTATISYILST